MCKRIVLAVLAFIMPAAALHAAAAAKTLAAFNWLPRPDELQTGANPDGTLLRDANGALYGTNMVGGQYYNGTVFKLSPPRAGQTDWNLSVIYTFTGGSDGGLPNPNLVMDASGAIYGTTEGGGSWTDQGLAYKLTPPEPGKTEWKQTVIHYFNFSYFDGPGDGTNPSGGLLMDKNGALYGTTDLGGDPNDPSGLGAGIIFKLTPVDAAKTKWEETILYRFHGGADGANPMAVLTLDSAGNLYGTTLYGGNGGCTDFLSEPLGCGTVFRLAPPAAARNAWTKTTLHHFAGAGEGAFPQAKVLVGASGALYGTTFQGGIGGCTDMLLNAIGCGIAFELAPPAAGQTAWAKTIIHTFTGPDGAYPQGGLIADANGALFGLASGGGPLSYGVVGGYGVLYKLTPPGFGQTRWAHTSIYEFDITTTGDTPIGELVRDTPGRFYGIANSGGPGYGGTVYEIVP